MNVSVWGWSVSVCVWRNAGKEPEQSVFFNPNISEQTDNFNETLVGGVSTHLKNISQIGSFPQVGGKYRKIKTTA